MRLDNWSLGEYEVTPSLPLLSGSLWPGELLSFPKGINAFPKGINLEVDVIARLEFEVVYFEATVQYASHFATEDFSTYIKNSYLKLKLFENYYYEIRRITFNCS